MKKRFSAFFLCILFLLCSCTVTEVLSNGQSVAKLETFSFFEDLASDISSWSSHGSESDVTDKAVETFIKNIEAVTCVSEADFVKTGTSGYEISFAFSDLKTLAESLSDGTEQDILTLSERDGKTRFDFRLDLENWNTLADLIPVLKEPNLEVYGPVYNNAPYNVRSEEDYYYMIDFIFGSGSEDIKQSFISLDFVCPSAVISTNGTVVSEKTVEFSIPLIDIILLHLPINFYCEW